MQSRLSRTYIHQKHVPLVITLWKITGGGKADCFKRAISPLSCNHLWTLKPFPPRLPPSSFTAWVASQFKSNPCSRTSLEHFRRVVALYWQSVSLSQSLIHESNFRRKWVDSRAATLFLIKLWRTLSKTKLGKSKGEGCSKRARVTHACFAVFPVPKALVSRWNSPCMYSSLLRLVVTHRGMNGSLCTGN